MAVLKDTLIQGSARVTDTLYSNIVNTSILNTDSLNTNENITLTSASGDSPAIIFDRGSTNTDWKLLVTAGKLSFQSRTGTNDFTERGYFADNSGAFWASTHNGLTLTAASTGFTIAGGTTSKTLTISDTVTLKTGSATYLAYYSAAGTISGHSLAHFSDEFGSSVANKKNELVLGNATAKATNGSSWGQIALYSPGTKGTYINSAENSTSWYTATLQAKTGTIAYTDDITAAIQGLDSTLPTGSAASKTLTALTIADGKMTAATFSDISIGANQVSSGTLDAARIPTLSITDKTSGTLTVERGGTGITTSTYKNAVVIGNSTTVTNALQTVRTAKGAFYSTGQDVKPTFGTLPLAQGGTGLSTLQPFAIIYGASSANGSAPGFSVLGPNGEAVRKFLQMTGNGSGSGSAPSWAQLSASDIASGTLSVARGGTGLTTSTSVNAVLIGNSSTATNAFQTVATASGAFYATGANAKPTFGKLPIAQGGTNATTAAAARANLGTAPYIQGVFYGTCTTAQATKAKQVILTNGEGFALDTGVVVFVKFTHASAASTMTMAISADNGSTYCTAKNLYRYATTTMSSGAATNGWRDGAMVCFVYDGTGWERIFWENSTYSYMRPYESTANGTTAAKTGAAGWKFQLTAGKYFMYSHYYDNTYAGPLTLNIGSTGAKPIYINGTASSASNHTLPGGQYLVYYDGTNYYFRTDNKMTGNITGHADQDLALSGGTMTGDITLPFNKALFGTLGDYYSVNSTDAGGLSWHQHSDGGSSATVNATDGPTNTWWYILRNRHTNTENNYYTDVAIPFNDDSIYYKAIRNNAIANASTNNGWVKVLDELNYWSYALPTSGGRMYGSIIQQELGVTRGATPSSINYRTMEWQDKDNKRLALVEHELNTTGQNRLSFYVLSNTNTSIGDEYGGIVIQKTAGVSGSNIAWYNANTGNFSATTVSGAVWNDYAEYRNQLYEVKPGYVVKDTDNGYVLRTEDRLIPGAQVVSDTYGFSIGETDKCKTPLAVSGRVLVYTYRPREEYHAGMAVCSAPGGTIDIMTREEIRDYPDAIIGIVSEIPNYEEWGSGKVKVDGRIWIKVR